MQDFQILTRFYYQLIQFIHHYAIAQKQVQQQQFWTKAFSKKIQDLNKFVKPAKPNQAIKTNIQNINEKWAQDTNQALKQHYETQIEENLKQIRQSALPQNKRQEAKETALNWARKRFKRKLTLDTIKLVNQTIQTNQFGSQNTTRTFLNTEQITPTQSTTDHREPNSNPHTKSKTSSDFTPTPQSSRTNDSTGRIRPLMEIRTQPTQSPTRTDSSSKSKTRTDSGTKTPNQQFGSRSPNSNSGSKSNTTPAKANTPQNQQPNDPPVRLTNSPDRYNIPVWNKFATLDSQESGIPENQTQYGLEYPSILEGNQTKTKPQNYEKPKPSNTGNPKTQEPENTIPVIGIHDPLSNFYKKPVKIQNSEFASGEHFFQYQKAIHFHRLDIADKIMDSNCPFEVRTLSKDIKIPNMKIWNPYSLQIMSQIFKAKYEQHMEFREKLMDSIGSTLVHPTKDNYWGTGSNNEGRNEFGNLLMTFRTQVTGGDIQVNISPTQTPPPSPPQTQSPTHTPTTRDKGPGGKKSKTGMADDPPVANSSPTPVVTNHNTYQNRESTPAHTTTHKLEGPQLKITLSPIKTHMTPTSVEPTEQETHLNSSLHLQLEITGEGDSAIPSPPHSPQNSSGNSPLHPPHPTSPPSSPPHRNTPPPSDSETTTPAQQNPKPGPTPENPFFSPDAPVTFKISPHMVYTRNIPPSKWEFPTPTKQVMIIGDSNVKEIQHTPHKDVNIFGYPGTNYNAITQMLKQTVPSKTPKHVILAVGINARRYAQATIEDSFRKLVSQTQKTYPEAQVYITGLNYSRKLTHTEKDTLDYLNENNKRHFLKKGAAKSYIPPIQSDQFHTGNDNIHVTQKTADNLLAHWLNHLNW